MADRPAPQASTLSVAGHRLTPLVEGPERLEALLALIGEAQKALRLLFYIWEADGSGTRIRDALARAAERGVDVAVLVDGFGAANANDRFFAPMVAAGVRFCRFVPRFGRRYLLRNHQKLAIADERVAIVGGFNISDPYFGTVESGAWRDLGLRVEGPDVRPLVAYYEDLFGWAQQSDGRIRTLRRLLTRHSQAGDALHWLFGGPTRRLSPWARRVRTDMLGATRLDMIAAYFAPSRAMLRRLETVARRGQVRIVNAAKSDNRFTVGAARHRYWRLLKAGAALYEYLPTKLHTKLIVIDDTVHIGSANFDMRSLYLNLEMMLRVSDAPFAEAMRALVEHEAEHSRRITLKEHRIQRTWWNRLRWSFAHWVIASFDYALARRLNFGADRVNAGPTSHPGEGRGP